MGLKIDAVRFGRRMPPSACILLNLRFKNGKKYTNISANGQSVSAEFELKAESGYIYKTTASTLKIHTLTEFACVSVD